MEINGDVIAIAGTIEKYCHAEEVDDWVKGEKIVEAGGKLLTTAIRSSSLAAVTYLSNYGRLIHLYFQGPDSKIREVIESIRNKKTTYRNGQFAIHCGNLDFQLSSN